MLVLSRKRNETVRISDNVVITVVQISGDKVRLGIEAPREVPVHRGEIYAAIKRNEATKFGPESGSLDITPPGGFHAGSVDEVFG